MLTMAPRGTSGPFIESTAVTEENTKEINPSKAPSPSQHQVCQSLFSTGLSLAVVWGLKLSPDDAVSAVRADSREGEGAFEGLISLVFSSVTAVLSINGPLVPLGAIVSI